jgi:hypothetical protein
MSTISQGGFFSPTSFFSQQTTPQTQQQTSAQSYAPPVSLQLLGTVLQEADKDLPANGNTGIIFNPEVSQQELTNYQNTLSQQYQAYMGFASYISAFYGQQVAQQWVSPYIQPIQQKYYAATLLQGNFNLMDGVAGVDAQGRVSVGTPNRGLSYLEVANTARVDNQANSLSINDLFGVYRAKNPQPFTGFGGGFGGLF